MIPEESDWVMSYDLRSISEKGKLNDPSEYSFMSDIQKEVKARDPEMKKLLTNFYEDPLSLGVDLSKEVMFFHFPQKDSGKTEEQRGIFGACAATWDRSQLRKNLGRILDIEENEELSIEDRNGRSFLQIGESLLAWDDSRILFLEYPSESDIKEEGKGALEQAESLFELKKKERLAGSSEDFQRFMERRKDISNWLALGRLSSRYADRLKRHPYMGMMGFDLEVEDLKVHSYLEFKEEEVELTHYNNDKRWAEWKEGLRDGVDKKLLGHLPEACYLGASMSYDLGFYYEKFKEKNEEDLKEWEEKLQEDTVDLEKLVSSLGGDFLFTIDGFDTYERTYTVHEPMASRDKSGPNGNALQGREVERTEEELYPRFNLIWNTEGAYLKELLKERWLKHDSLEMMKEGQYRYDGFGFPVFFGWNEDKMLLSSNEKSFSGLYEGGYQGSSSLLGAEAGDLFANSAHAGFLVMNLEEYPKVLRDKLRSDYGSVGEGIMEKMTSIFDRLKVKNLEEENGLRVTLGLKEGEGNSLERILKQMDENYRSVMMAL